MKITLVEKEVVRHDCPNNSAVNNRIKQIQKNVIGSYSAIHLPHEGDVISFSNGKNYDIIKVVHIVKKLVDDMYSAILPEETDVVLEVCEHSSRHFFNSGSNSFFEEIPLVTEIENAK